MISSIIREFTKEEKEQLAEEQRPEVQRLCDRLSVTTGKRLARQTGGQSLIYF